MYSIYRKNRILLQFRCSEYTSESLCVTEVGYSVSTEPTLYRSKKDYYALHFLFTGEGEALLKPIKAPMGFIMEADDVHSIKIDITENSPKWEHYWISFRGNDSKDLLKAVGFPCESSLFEIKNAPKIKKCFEEFFNEHRDKNIYGNFMLNAFFMQILSLNYNAELKFDQAIDNKRMYVDSAVDYIKQNYYNKLQEKDIASVVGINSKYLYRLFKEYLGISTIEYLNQWRIECAKNMIKYTGKKITEIAVLVGYDDPSYFTCVFKKYNNGISPLEYRHSVTENR